MDTEPHQHHASPAEVTLSQYVAARYARGGSTYGPLSQPEIIPIRLSDDEYFSHTHLYPGGTRPGANALALARTAVHLLHDCPDDCTMPDLLRQPAFPRAYRADAHSTGGWHNLVAYASPNGHPAGDRGQNFPQKSNSKKFARRGSGFAGSRLACYRR